MSGSNSTDISTDANDGSVYEQLQIDPKTQRSLEKHAKVIDASQERVRRTSVSEIAEHLQEATMSGVGEYREQDMNYSH